MAVLTADRQVEIKDLERRVVGQVEREARKTVTNRGFQFRVSRRNGRPQVGTRDYCPDRINVRVDNGVIVEAHLG